jgi:hypothetical protein
MNMEERQQPLHAPQGTSAPPLPDRNVASVPLSHIEKLPAGTPPSSFWLSFSLLIPNCFSYRDSKVR